MSDPPGRATCQYSHPKCLRARYPARKVTRGEPEELELMLVQWIGDLDELFGQG